MSDDLFQSTFVARNHPFRGPNESKKLNSSERENSYDHIQVAKSINSLNNDMLTKAKALSSQNKSSREGVLAETERDAIDKQYNAIEGNEQPYYQTFRSFENILFDTSTQSIDQVRRIRVDPVFGEATLPYNGIASLFFSRNFSDDSIVTSPNLVTSVSSIDEGVGVVTEGTVTNAFNGVNESYWLREVTFPLDSDQASVTVRLDITVPTSFQSNANLIHVRPTLPGWVDILDLQYSTTAADPSITLPGFTAENSVSESRYIFAPLPITKISITIRSRNFVQQDGRKVFFLGLEEFGMELVDFDKTFNASQLLDNNALITKIDAQNGYKFNNITNFISNPGYATMAGDLGIYYKIFTDQDLTNLAWYSFTDPNPFDTPVDISAENVSSVYVVTMLEYSNALSVPPVLDNFSLKYNTEAL